ncbi:NAD(P)H-dependent glycerol-3-phosphate dehydrogenase [Nakamurella sp. YIM 132087]|uniref:Glycerol-3-phosphate dehydrogenase [NAD(P)+] n=2 Tax=Nakamurella alba TaxID=2665158 RepID=A0A7K1FIM9_9ACTN|nr:NAD(P)H-dependent glycerol-3-phosphate dehydrogenase [Nakamurella alba]
MDGVDVPGRIAVLGAGSWGTTFAKVLADAGREVVLWARRESVAASIRSEHRNPDYLTTAALPENLDATSDFDAALAGAQAVVLGVPSQSLRENLQVFRDAVPAGVPVVSLAKGVEIGTGLRMSEVISSVGRIAPRRVVVLTGPNLAPEIAAGQPTAAVLACSDHDTAVRMQLASATPYFRPYTITDVVGAEIAGTGKNVIALACGMAEGLGLGLNTAASLITRGLNELTRLGEKLGALPATLAGLAGLGDLVATCSSPLSRNRTLGSRLAQGSGLEAALEANGGQVAEGVVSCRSMRDLAHRHGVDMPITDGVYRVCYQHETPASMIGVLMNRPYSPE